MTPPPLSADALVALRALPPCRTVPELVPVLRAALETRGYACDERFVVTYVDRDGGRHAGRLMLLATRGDERLGFEAGVEYLTARSIRKFFALHDAARVGLLLRGWTHLRYPPPPGVDYLVGILNPEDAVDEATARLGTPGG